MNSKRISAPDAPQPEGGYSQAVELTGYDRILYVSGQIPITDGGSVPETFDAQCHPVWDNVEAQLRAANMGLDDLVKITTFLSERQYATQNSVIRQQRLGDTRPSLTIIITDIYNPDWLLEIEAIAAE